MSVTTIEAAGRLARHMRGGDFTKLSVSEVGDIRQSMNAGLMLLYTLLPERFRRTPVSVMLGGPRNVSVDVTNGSADLGNSPFTTDEIGQSVVVDGDANWNEITAVNALMDAYLGNTGSKNAVIYNDSALDATYSFERMVTLPTLTEQRKQLLPMNARDAGWLPSIGMPRYFWVEDLSAAIGGEPRFVVRVFPAPDRAYNLKIVLSLWPSRNSLADLITPKRLYVPDEFYESVYIPLCLGHLTLSPAWGNPDSIKGILAAAADARGLAVMQPGQTSVPKNRVETPCGY